MARPSESGGQRHALLLMTLRLLLFVSVAAWVNRVFGTVAVASFVAGAIVARATLLMAWKNT